MKCPKSAMTKKAGGLLSRGGGKNSRFIFSSDFQGEIITNTRRLPTRRKKLAGDTRGEQKGADTKMTIPWNARSRLPNVHKASVIICAAVRTDGSLAQRKLLKYSRGNRPSQTEVSCSEGCFPLRLVGKYGIKKALVSNWLKTLLSDPPSHKCGD